MTDVLIKRIDVETAGFCMSGMRLWAQTNGLEHRILEVHTTGVPVEVVRAFDCPLGNRVCVAAEERTRKEVSNGQQ